MIKYSQLFVKKMKNVRPPQGGGSFFLAHTVHATGQIMALQLTPGEQTSATQKQTDTDSK